MNPTMIINSPLKVICVNPKGSIKLIKGGVYYATELNDFGTAINGQKRVLIKGMGYYYASNFKLENGECLDIHETFVLKSKSLDVDNINYTGTYVRCNHSGSIHIKEGEIYYVEKQFSKILRGSTYSYDYLKLSGIKKNVYAYLFEEITISEQRALKLRNLNGEKIKTGDKSRKFTLYSEKEKVTIFLEGLMKSLSDINRIQNSNNIDTDICKMIVNKCKKYDAVEKDFEEFFKLDIKTILEIYNIKF